MKKVLLVDADPFTLCVLDVSLRRLGYTVATAADGADAWSKIEAGAPDVIVSDTRLPKLDGLGLVRKLKDRSDLSRVPVIFLASQESVTDRERALELGVEDYLAKPAYVRELTARIDLLLARSARQHVATASQATGFSRGKLSGSTEELAVVDMIQSFERARKTGVLYLRHGLQEAVIYFREGKTVDARMGELRGEEAIYRALVWTDASFEIEFRPVTEEDIIGRSTHAVLMKGMRRLDDWERLCKQVEPLATLLDIHAPLLVERLTRLGEVPDLEAMFHLPFRPPADVAAPAPERAREEPSERVAARPVHTQEIPVAAVPRPAPAPVVTPPPSPSATMTPPPPSSPPPPVRPVASPVLAVVTTPVPSAALAPASTPPSARPSFRPSAAPWTREIGPGSEVTVETEEVAAGVPRGMGSPARRTTLALVAAAAVLVLGVGAYSMRGHSGAEEAKQTGVETPVAAAAPAPVPAPTEVAPAPAQVAAEAPANAAPSAPPSAEPAPAPAPEPVVAANAPVAAAAPALPAAGTELGLLGASALRPAKVVRETALDVKTSLTSVSPLVRDAERALLKGDTDKAQALSQQAVAESPGDADAWLTLAAARKASGDMLAAREAYKNCIEQAHTVNVDHCRVLAASR